MSTRTALSIGTFDGVHAGHRALVRRAREHAGEGGRVVVLCFDPHPREVLSPGTEPARLTTFEQRARLLREAGATHVERLEPTRDLLGTSPKRFIERLCQTYRPDWFVEGEDFRFGKGRAGGVERLRELGAGGVGSFEVDIVPAVMVTLRDQSVVRASSSLARWLIARGRVRDAAYVLGRRYAMPASVVRGDRRGRELGFPTANLVSACQSPGDGVYAGIVKLADGRRFAAAVNAGERPTFKGLARTLEAHLIMADEPGGWAPIEGLAEYGWSCELELVGWIRDQARYPSPDALRAQLVRDCARVRDVVARAEPGLIPEPAA